MDTKYIPKTPTPQEVFGCLGLYFLTHPGVATPEASRWKVPPSAPCQTTCGRRGGWRGTGDRFDEEFGWAYGELGVGKRKPSKWPFYMGFH